MLDFLVELFDSGLQYSAINTARSALSTFISINNTPIGSHPLLRRFLKGVFQQRPAIPRYSKTWDVSLVLKFLRKWSPLNSLGIKQLTMKLAMLLALTTAQRCQTLYLLHTNDIEIFSDKVELRVKELVKHSRPGVHLPVFTLPKCQDAVDNCVGHVLSMYLERTKPLRPTSTTKLFISFVKPHKEVSKSTISRWIKTVMALSGIDTAVFTAHSTRSASVSKAQSKDLPLDIILQTAGWSNARTFQKFYNKSVDKELSFAKTVTF